MSKTFVDMRPFKPSEHPAWSLVPGYEERGRAFDSVAASPHIFVVDHATTMHLYQMANGLGISEFKKNVGALAGKIRFPFREMVIDYAFMEDDGESTRFISFISDHMLFSASADATGKIMAMPFYIDLERSSEEGDCLIGKVFTNNAISEAFKDENVRSMLRYMPNSVMTMLLMMAFDSGFAGFDKVPARSFMKGNKRIAVPATTSVTIRLWEKAKRSIIKSLEYGHHSSPRLHDVRGHWMHYDLIEHEHEWKAVESSDGKIRQVCSCGARRTWRSEFERGDASKGVVVKTYKVES